MKRFLAIIFVIICLAAVITADDYVAKTTIEGLPLEEDFWIASGELDQILQQTLANLEDQGYAAEKYFDTPYLPSEIGISSILLEFLYEEKILSYFAASNDLIPTKEEVDAETEQLLEFYMSDEMMMMQIEMMYGSIEQFETLIRDSVFEMLKYEKVYDHVVDISEEALGDFFETNKEYIRSELEYVSAKHILVDSEDLAVNIKERIEDGLIAFEDAAYEYSTDTHSGAEGGMLGVFGRGQMIEPFEEASFSAPIGEIYGPVETQFGFHLILVEERFLLESFEQLQPGTQEYEEFVDFYRQVEFEDWFSDYLEETSFAMEVLDPDIKLYERYVGVAVDPSSLADFRDELVGLVFQNGLIDPDSRIFPIALFVQISTELDMTRDADYMLAVNHLYELLPESQMILDYAVDLHQDDPEFIAGIVLRSLREFTELLRTPDFLEQYLDYYGEDDLMSSIYANVEFFLDELVMYTEEGVSDELLSEFRELIIETLDITLNLELSQKWIDILESAKDGVLELTW